MAKILMNINDLKQTVDSFFENFKKYVKKEFVHSSNKSICTFIINSKECKISFHYGKKGISIIPEKNPELSKEFIDFITSKAIKNDAVGKQFVVKNISVFDSLIKYLTDMYSSTIRISNDNNKYVLTGYHSDKITITKHANNFVIQGKPYYVFQKICDFLIENSNISFEEFVNENNTFSGNNKSFEDIRSEIKKQLPNSYNYMSQAQLKALSSSFAILSCKIPLEDYSASLAGIFKALEGYLKKILSTELGYTLQKNNTFYMLKENPNTHIAQIDTNNSIDINVKRVLKELYNVYHNSRNVYLHSTVDPTQMSIIESYEDAISIKDEILSKIENAHTIIFRS